MSAVDITIDRDANIHISTALGVGRLAILNADGSVIDTPGLSEQIGSALVDALLDELTPTLRRVSRPLSPPVSALSLPTRQHRSPRPHAKRQTAG